VGTAAASDNCGSVTVTNNKPATFPLGEPPSRGTATDSYGNFSTATQKVKIFGRQSAHGTAPPDIEVMVDPGQCYWTVNSAILGTATVTTTATSRRWCRTMPASRSRGAASHYQASHRCAGQSLDGRANRDRRG
jgi:hypothetical protein